MRRPEYALAGPTRPARRRMRLFFLLAGLLVGAVSASAADWPQWRGPTGMGQAPDTGLPLTWGGPEGLSIRWKADLPKAHNPWSSPIVVGERVFLTTSTFEPVEHRVLCFSKADGKLLWSTPVAPGPWKLTDSRSTYCAPTPASDGKLLYVHFGSAVVAALDLGGKVVWRRELERYAFDVAEAGSPLLFGDTVVLLCDQNQGKSSLVAFEKQTGKIAWEAMRPQQGFCHSTPLLVTLGGAPQLLVSASNALQGVDPASGKVLWWCAAQGDVTTPVYANGIAYTDSGRGNPGVAVRVPGTGDVTATQLLWKMPVRAEVLASPVIVGEYLYRLVAGRNLACVEMATGKEVYSQPLPGVSTWSSPVVTADGRIYFAGAGKSYVVKAGPQFEILGSSDLGDTNPSSPAVAGGLLFLRGNRCLYCIGTK